MDATGYILFMAGVLASISTAATYYIVSAIVRAIHYELDATLCVFKLRLHTTYNNTDRTGSYTMVPDTSTKEAICHGWYEWKGDSRTAMNAASNLFMCVTIGVITSISLYYQSILPVVALFLGVVDVAPRALFYMALIGLIGLSVALPIYLVLRVSIRFRIAASVSCDVTKRLRLRVTLDHTNGIAYTFTLIGEHTIDTQRQLHRDKYTKTGKRFMRIDEQDINERTPLFKELVPQLAEMGYDVLRRESRTYLAYNGRSSMRAEFVTRQRLYLTQKYINRRPVSSYIEIDLDDINDQESPLFEENVTEFERMGFTVSYHDTEPRQMRLQPVEK